MMKFLRFGLRLPTASRPKRVGQLSDREDTPAAVLPTFLSRYTREQAEIVLFHGLRLKFALWAMTVQHKLGP
jgi:hypothetical protein